MATTYSWTINQMYTVQQPDPDYVVNVIWSLTGTNGTYTASIGGNTAFASNQESGFIPYEDLTEAVVISWVQNSLGEQGIANYEANVQGQIDSQIFPPVSPENTPLPWAAPAE
jgi:hypothetical protein